MVNDLLHQLHRNLSDLGLAPEIDDSRPTTFVCIEKQLGTHPKYGRLEGTVTIWAAGNRAIGFLLQVQGYDGLDQNDFFDSYRDDRCAVDYAAQAIQHSLNLRTIAS